MRCSAEDGDSSKNLAGQSAQTETLASFDLTPALPCVASIVVAEDLAAPSAVSSIDKMRRPKRPPLRSTRPPSAPTTVSPDHGCHSIRSRQTCSRSLITHLTRKSPETGIHRTQDYRPWQEWFPRTLPLKMQANQKVPRLAPCGSHQVG